MKKIFNILVLTTAVIVFQACDGKSDKTSETDSSSMDSEASMTSEEVASLEKKRADREEQRSIARAELAATNPTYKNDKGELVYIKPEVDPSFEGGNRAMMTYLRKEVKYPQEAKDRGDEGTVFVDFVVGKNGGVRGVEITDVDSKTMDQSLRDEAVRVVSSMPAWSPGRQQGEPVNVKFSIPITFQMK